MMASLPTYSPPIVPYTRSTYSPLALQNCLTLIIVIYSNTNNLSSGWGCVVFLCLSTSRLPSLSLLLIHTRPDRGASAAAW